MQFLLYRKVAALLEPQETYAELVNSFQVWLATCNVEIYSLHLFQELRCIFWLNPSELSLYPTKIRCTLLHELLYSVHHTATPYELRCTGAPYWDTRTLLSIRRRRNSRGDTWAACQDSWRKIICRFNSLGQLGRANSLSCLSSVITVIMTGSFLLEFQVRQQHEEALLRSAPLLYGDGLLHAPSEPLFPSLASLTPRWTNQPARYRQVGCAGFALTISLQNEKKRT